VTPRARVVLAGASCAALLVMLATGFAGLPAFGHYPGPYGTVLAVVGVHERIATNVVTSIMFDYRGLDSLGEEFILLAAVTGLALILRNEKVEVTNEPLPRVPGRATLARTDAVRLAGLVALGIVVVFGLYVGIHASLTPGGGFQGGAIVASGLFLAYLGLRYTAFAPLARQAAWDAGEAVGGGGYVVIGLATLFAGGAFLKNTLPLGGSGQLFSSGTIAVINVCVLLEVIAGFVLMFLEFARATRVEREKT
jgi:multicomponent Na+:H+ antiporter subunit B